MSKYSKINKLLHRLYLGNHFISKASFEIEESFFEKKIRENKITSKVFVSGLARSGTTNFMRKIYQTGKFASLQYADMPFLLLPNLWKNKKQIERQERAHRDGIQIDADSPEEFDEYFWKVFTNNAYIQNELHTHPINDELLSKFDKYISLICLAKNKNQYLSKNNNNILRIADLKKLENAHFFFLVRNPSDHASSLLKLHKLFCEEHKRDSFNLDYFNYLGHHEFGLNHKPFILEEGFEKEIKQFDTRDINYWLLNWKQYYNYLLDKMDDRFHLVVFEDLIRQPTKVFQYVNNFLDLNIIESKNPFTPPTYRNNDMDQTLLKTCETIYQNLRKRIEY